MESLLDSGKYSDLSLQCKEKTWKVHRAIVCTSSTVFTAMVDSGFKEGQNQEINLPDDEPHIVEKMLRFIYQRDYDDGRHDLDTLLGKKVVPLSADPEEPAEPTSHLYGSLVARAQDGWAFQPSWDEPPKVSRPPKLCDKALVINVQVYIIADKNDIGELKDLAAQKYKEVVEHFWNSPSFASSAKLLYDNTPQSDRLLRDVIAGTAKKNILTLIDRQDFETVMVDHGDLAVDVLKSVLLRGGEVSSDNSGHPTVKKHKKKGIRVSDS